MKNKAYKILIIVFIIIFIINIFSIFNLPFFGFRVYKIGSGSMEPYLKVNDLIVIKKHKDYKVGDVVTYRSNSEYVTHRIIEIDGDTVVTKGDNNNIADKPIKKNRIIGSLAFKLHILSFIGYMLTNPFSWIMFFIAGLVITILIPDKKRKERS